MKEAFKRLLADNGIHIPKQHPLEPAPIFKIREKNFWKKWNCAFDAFKQFENAAEIMNNGRLWLDCNKISSEFYSKPIIRTPTPIIQKFATPNEAVISITSALSKCRNPREELCEIRVNFIKCWFFNLVENRPDGCTIIVVKDPNYTPKPENVGKFAMDIDSKEAARISYFNGITEQIYWIAVPVEKYKEQKFSDWFINPHTAIIQCY